MLLTHESVSVHANETTNRLRTTFLAKTTIPPGNRSRPFGGDQLLLGVFDPVVHDAPRVTGGGLMRLCGLS